MADGLNVDAGQVGIATLLLAAMTAGARQVWVWGWTYRELKAQYEAREAEHRAAVERLQARIDELVDRLLEGTEAVERASDVAVKAAEVAKGSRR